MAKQAVLSVCGEDFNLLEFNINLRQKVNNLGKPASGVFLGDFYFIIEGGTDIFFDWISNPTRMESGSIKVYYKKGESPFVEYTFVQGFVTTILENLYDNEGIENAFNSISIAEDSSESFELWTNLEGTGFKSGDLGHLLTNTVAKTRQFQQRTGIDYVLMITLSCEEVQIRKITHKNEWETQRR